MRVVRTAGELANPLGAQIGFVPTMGALHEGHLELIRAAKAECGYCVVSIFVNPTQFAEGEDYERYPRDEEHDLGLARSVGADVVFAPSVSGMFPRRTTTIHVGEITRRWEGERRPGHFEGVATVVCKLFHLVRPDVAFFGIKDYQQCLVVGRMVEDLDMTVKLRFVDTVREADGLAMSSRNRILDPERRRIAPVLYRTLVEAKDELGSASLREVDGVVDRHRIRLEDAGFVIEYFALVDPHTLEPKSHSGEARLIVAVRLGDTRLIDNVGVFVPPSG